MQNITKEYLLYAIGGTRKVNSNHKTKLEPIRYVINKTVLLLLTVLFHKKLTL